jgi:MFS family permease
MCHASYTDLYLAQQLGRELGNPDKIIFSFSVCAYNLLLCAGEGPCLATFFVRRYWQLMLLRVMTGISVGGTFPLIFSLVGDLFSVKQRANVAAGVQVATGVGFAGGQAIAGFVGGSCNARCQ